MLVGYIASTELEHALKNVADYSDSTRCHFKEFTTPEVVVSNGNDRPKGTDFTDYMDQVIIIIFIIHPFLPSLRFAD